MNLDVIIDIADVKQNQMVKQKIKKHSIEFYEPILAPQKLYIKIEKENLDIIKKEYPKINIKPQRRFQM